MGLIRPLVIAMSKLPEKAVNFPIKSANQRQDIREASHIVKHLAVNIDPKFRN